MPHVEANTVVLTILALVTFVNTMMAQRRGKKAEVAADEVKETLAVSGEATIKKLDDIHKLVNSEYAIALRVGAAALERIAASSMDPKDLQEAQAARKLSIDHDQKQAALDRAKKSSEK